MTKQYAERDAFELDQAGGHYMRHVMAMTAEQLHSKSDIAAELAWRDSQIVALQQKLDAIGQSAQWKPEICPITRRPFFMWIEHPSDGMVPTYGGPLDSYTIPTLDSDGEFCCERFDHDEGCWVDSDCVGICLTNDQEPEIDTAYLNSVRADAIPEGYVLVPQSMNVSADAMESICFHGGDGGGQFGEFTDVILWIGAIENDDGTKTYGLNITTTEYPEEGSANISEFAESIDSGTHDTADKAG